MDNSSRSLDWRDWAVFGLRWLVLVLLSVGTYTIHMQTGATDGVSFITPAVAVGVVANIIVALFMLVAGLRQTLAPVTVIADVAIAVAFARLVGDDTFLLFGIAVALIFSNAFRLGAVWGTIQVIGILGGISGSLIMARGTDSALALISGGSSVLPLLMGALALVAVFGNFIVDGQSVPASGMGQPRRTGGDMSDSAMRMRARAIYEIASTLSSTLSHDKILDAALDAGRAVVSDTTQRGVSMALLWKEDETLYVGSARGLMRGDEARVVPGKSGIIAQALEEGVAVSTSNAAKDPELQKFSTFGTISSALCVPLQAGYNKYGVLVYGNEAEDAFTEDDTDLLSAIGTQVTVALQNAVLYRDLVQEKERIIVAEEEARKRMARELHDGPTQTVSSSAMYLNVVYRTLEADPSQLPEQLEQIKKVENMVREAAKEMREFMSRWRPLTLENQGLQAALEFLAKQMKDTHNQNVAIRVGRDIEEILDTRQQGVVFAIAEEAVNNARKHAKAPVISVTVGRKEDVVIVQIADNGVGFDTGVVEANNYSKRGSLGMVNLRDRANLLEGTLHIDSAPGKGTKITVVFPLKTNQLIGGGKNGRLTGRSAGGSPPRKPSSSGTNTPTTPKAPGPRTSR